MNPSLPVPLPSRVALCQLRMQDGSPAEALHQLRQLLGSRPPPAGTLVLLPELWSSGADLRRLDEAARATPALLESLREEAARRRLLIAGSLPESGATPADRCRNTLFLVGPEGVLGRYHKQRLFPPWQEDRHVQPGDGPAPLPSPLGPLAALVCYDLRFPSLVGPQVRQGAQLLLVSALWPSERLLHWQVLLQARAIEHQVYVAGCNGSGVSNGIELAGHSRVIAPDGRVLLELGQEQACADVALDAALPAQLRRRFSPVGESPWPGDDADKVAPLDTVRLRLHCLRQLGSRIVFTNGCFDLLHSGHVRYLQAARRAGDILVLGLNSDRSVRAIKGPSRPVNGEADRARVLAALGCVDVVVIFDEETPLSLIEAIAPDVLVKGADWPEEQIVGASQVRARGGTVLRIPFERDISTSAILRRIGQNQG